VTVVLGIDGGGTKTHAVLADGSGALLGVGRSGPSNWEDVGVDAAGDALLEAAGEAAQAAGIGPGEVDGASIGLAGVDWASDHERLASALARLGLNGPSELVNDAFVALRAGANHPWGIVVIAGTGAIAAGRNQRGEEFRTHGQGRLLGDFGSGTDVAEEGIRAVAEAQTEIGPQTSLSSTLPALAGAASPEAFLEAVSRASTSVEAFAAPVLEAAEAGDMAARSIVERAGSSLGLAAGVVTRRLGMEEESVEVVLSGGLFRSASRLLVQSLERELRRQAPRAVTMRLEVPPVVGAALRAMELLGSEPAGAVHLRLSLEVIKTLHYELA
jgi:N-acetylglucosamine kinase-like BadF-type ATPase